MVCAADHLVIPAMADGDDAAAPGLGLFHIARHPVVGAVPRSERDYRHALVDERDGPVLHLTGGIALGVDIGDLLELERALERDRVLDPAAEVEEALACRQVAGERADGSVGGPRPPPQAPGPPPPRGEAPG